MKKNDLIKTEDGIYRILSIEANRVLAIDCIKKTMPKFYPVSSFGNGKNIDCIPADFTDMEDLSPADRKVAQERYTMIATLTPRKCLLTVCCHMPTQSGIGRRMKQEQT